MCRLSAVTALPLTIVGICLACNDPEIPAKNRTVEATAIINLSAVTNPSQTEVFHEVRHVNLLPSSVLHKLGGIADQGQPFNISDAGDLRLPWRSLIVAAVSEKYCIVSYAQGGMFFRPLETTIFELSQGAVKREWFSVGGGLNFRDLKATVESGHILEFKRVL